MANDLNLCVLTGRLGADPEVRHTGSGTAVVNIRIAVGGRKKVNDSWEDTVEWVPVVMWGRTAEIACEYLRKGSHIRVSGRFQTREWEQDGAKRYMSEIVCNELQMLGGKGDGQQQAPRQAAAPRQGQTPAGPYDLNDDIPFDLYQRRGVV